MTENSLKQYLVSGSVQSADRGSIGGLIVRLVDKHIGPDVDVAETTTDETGAYQIAVTLPPATLQQKQKDKPDFQVLVYTGDTFLGASEIRYNASSRETLDVELTEGLTALPSEYELLTQGLKRAYEGNLAELQETAARQDITYLANKTQWDANAVALAALAEQFSLGAVSSPAFATPGGQPQGSVSAVALPANTPNSPGTAPLPPTRAGLAPAFFYALFRAGIPANADGLFQTSPTTVQAVWEQAIKQGVIPAALASQVSDAVQHFEALSTAHTLDANPPVGISTLREMLQTSLSDAGQQEQFARAYVHHRDDTDAFWNALQQSLGEAQTQQLRLNGKLFYLTLNNAPLVRALHDVQQHEPLASTLDLATRGYHDPAKWTSLIGTSVPSQISGDSDVEKRAKYAELLAAKVRTAHPTAVVSDHVRRGAFRLSDPSVEPAHVADFLIEHEGGFAIGQEPVEAYIARTKLAGAPAPLIGQIKRLQRVYQITPNDQTMGVLLRHDLDSAHAIARYSAAGFERTFEAKLGGPSNALAIHARAKQIHSAVLNIAVSYLGARVAPRLGGNSPVHVPFPDLPLEASSGVIAYPTLESLFGSLDYCNCRECRSILSPAAYFVDLLHFLDHPAPSQGYQNPQSELFRRRPDLQYLALTCENTNTALPYIDIVNETLEYFVANNTSLDNFRGHDTDDSVTSKELLASPQYVNDSAYDTLRSTFFPPPLPFNRPLELLRLHLTKLGVALPELMQTLRVDDAIERANRANHGWRDILMEELALSREEHQLLTELAKVGLEALYGYPVNSNALATLRDMNLQDFSRRTGVSYDDLFSIVRTQFINPNAILIPRLERLGVPFATLQALKNGPLSAAAFKAMLPEGLDAMKYGGNASTDLDSVVKWVTDAPNYARITSIVTITDPSNGPDQCSGAALQFRYSEPGSANKLTATDFVKLIRFIRLWRKLGLSITQTDDILTALYPAADMPAGTDDGANLRLLDSGFLTLLPRVGFLFRIMKQLALKADADLAPLLACWAPIGTARNDSLYHKMFLGPTVQELGPQTATIDGPVNLGDRFKTTINGIPIPDQGYVDTGDGPAIVADDIASSINRTSTIDPDSDRPLNSRVQASSQGGVITIRAGFTLECATSPGASASYASNAQSPLIHTATVAGPVTKDDVLITIINDSPFRYTVVPGDTPITIASKIALAINETTTPEPFSGVPLNTLVVASNQAEVIRFEAVNAGAPFRLACSLALVPTGTYALTASSPESWTATITVTQIPVIPTYRIITTINGIDLIFSTLGSTYTAADLANSVVNLIANASQPDPVTGRALNSLVQAQAGAMTRIGRQTTEVVITITALDRATRF